MKMQAELVAGHGGLVRSVGCGDSISQASLVGTAAPDGGVTSGFVSAQVLMGLEMGGNRTLHQCARREPQQERHAVWLT